MSEEFLKKADKKLKREERVLEKDHEAEFVKYVKSNGCVAFKLIFLNQRGFPDRTVLFPKGKVAFFEFKRKGEKLRPTQVAVKNTLERFGFQYYVCYSCQDAKSHFERILAAP